MIGEKEREAYEVLMASADAFSSRLPVALSLSVWECFFSCGSLCDIRRLIGHVADKLKKSPSTVGGFCVESILPGFLMSSPTYFILSSALSDIQAIVGKIFLLKI